MLFLFLTLIGAQAYFCYNPEPCQDDARYLRTWREPGATLVLKRCDALTAEITGELWMEGQRVPLVGGAVTCLGIGVAAQLHNRTVAWSMHPTADARAYEGVVGGGGVWKKTRWNT